MISGLLRECRTEVDRCASSIAAGGDPRFWRWRLDVALTKLLAATAILQRARDQLPPEHQPGDEGSPAEGGKVK